MDGTFTFRRKGKPNKEAPNSLPCFSVASERDAKKLRTLVCRLAYDGRYIYSGREFDNTIEGLEAAGETMAQLYEQSRDKRKGE